MKKIRLMLVFATGKKTVLNAFADGLLADVKKAVEQSIKEVEKRFGTIKSYTYVIEELEEVK